jgi:uncharacterized protein YprB with RNaseH-like and TPR domain
VLRHTFCHLPGVGEKGERRLWDAGVTCWDDAARARRLDPTSLRASADQHAGRNPAWFGDRLPAAQAWRLFHDFRDCCAYLDIETTGLLGSGYVTTVALYDGRSVRTYVHGHNLDDFCRDVADYRLLITYNGKPSCPTDRSRRRCRPRSASSVRPGRRRTAAPA